MKPAYELNGSNWNDYVVNDGPDAFTASDTACPRDVVTSTSDCLHGGELRKVVIPGATSCQGLALQDALGLFNWECRLLLTGDVAFFSSGFRDGMGLRDVVTPTGWTPDSVTLSGSMSGSSATATWWSNTVQPLPPNTSPGSLVLAAPGVVYVAPDTRPTNGYTIVADGISVVTLNNRVLVWGGGPLNCQLATGLPDMPDHSCTISVANASFVWLEVSLEGLGSGARSREGIMLTNVRHSRVHSTFSERHEWDELLVRANSSGNRVTRSLFQLGGDGVWSHEGAGFNRFENVLSAHHDYRGFYLGGALGGDELFRVGAVHNGEEGMIVVANNTRLNFIKATNNGTMGISMLSSGNVLLHALLAHNDDHAISVTGNDNTISHLTAVANLSSVRFLSGTGHVLHQALIVDTGSNLRVAAGTRDNTFAQIVTGKGDSLVTLEAVGNTRFTGVLMGEGACVVDPATNNEPLVNGTCTLSGGDGSSDYHPASLSNAVLRPGRYASTSFQGAVFTDDLVNGSDVNGGVSTFPAPPESLDWTSFEHDFRTWGPDGDMTPWLSGPGRIWDWSLRPADTVVFGRSDDGASLNEPFIVDENCPGAVHGDRVATDLHNPPHTFLLNAAELMRDGNGNDNGLCESNERCVYSPHFGAFQGVGALASCVFQDGVVGGVEMYGIVSVR
ncbi:MAG: hypothetical protein AB2A00_21165 [Myxococcota bacterium]